MSESASRVNGLPFEDPRSFFSGARDLMVNGLDLLEELAEVTIESAQKPPPIPSDPTKVQTVRSQRIRSFGWNFV